jgi:hypothetical protein
MKYLCMIYTDEAAIANRTKEEADKLMAEYMELTASFQRNGHYIGANRLQPVHTATTVRLRNGSLSTTDGPYAETKEQLGGYYLLEARDLNQAIQLAARIPAARFGSIEVRPLAELPAAT